MSDLTAIKIQELSAKLHNWNYQYYVLDSPSVTDHVYDQHLRELMHLEQQHPELAQPDSPTQRVGAIPSSSFTNVKHPIPMYSLANAMNETEFTEFMDSVNQSLGGTKCFYTAELKLDGLAVALLYSNGTLMQALTRGDGVSGEDVTANVRTIGNIPLEIDCTQRTLVVHGEIVMPRDAFDSLNEQREERGQKTFATPRNAAAGSVRQHNPKVTAERTLLFVAYSVHENVTEKQLDTQYSAIAQLQKWGFTVSQHFLCDSNRERLLAFYNDVEAMRANLPYDIDGVVYKVDHFDKQQYLGERSRSPRWAIAYKFPAQEKTTTLVNVLFQTGRTGVITPVAILDTVTIDGVMVSQATLHNFDEIERLNLHYNDTVVLHRAGDVIPKITDVIADKREKGAQKVSVPTRCPECKGALKRIDDGVKVFCMNGFRCPAQAAEALVHFASREAMDIEGLGPGVIQQLSSAVLMSVSDLYHLSAERLRELPGFGEKSIAKLLDAIDRSRETTLPRFLYALGIPSVGIVTAQELAMHFGSLDAIRNAKEVDLRHMDGVGKNMAKDIVAFFRDKRNQQTMDALIEAGVHWPEVKTPADQGKPLHGEKWALTGELHQFPRNAAKTVLQDLGARITGTVSGQTHGIVVGENPGKKYTQAQQLGVPIYNEDQFRQLLLRYGVV